MARANAQVPRQQFFDNAGRPLSGGKLYVFESGSSSIPATVWMDHDTAEDNQHEHPIVLDSAGRTPGPIVLEPGKPYRFQLLDADDVLLWTEDRVQAVGSDEPDLTTVDQVHIRSEANNALRVAGGVQVNGRQTIGTDGLIGQDSVDEDAIKDSAVTTDKVADGSITADKLAAGAVPSTLSAGSVGTDELADNAVTEAKLADTAVGTSNLKDRAVTNPTIGLQAVHAENLKDGHVTRTKMATDVLARLVSEEFERSADQALTSSWVAVNDGNGTDLAVEVTLVEDRPILLLATVTVFLNPQGEAEIQIVRGSSAVVGPNEISVETRFIEPISLIGMDQPGAGTHTYTVQAKLLRGGATLAHIRNGQGLSIAAVVL